MRKSVSQATRFQIQKLLESVIDVDNGCVKYQEGWNDARVAEHFETSSKTVANTRNNTFGKLCGRTPSTKQRLADIEARLDVLENTQIIDLLENNNAPCVMPKHNDGEINAS